jgi:uncharacterized membrane protein
MQKSNFLTQRNVKSFFRFLITTLLVLFALKFVIDALPYFGMKKETLGRFWNVKWALIGHISGGISALAIGPFQFSKSFRNKFINTHRWLGRIYLTAILIAAISSTYLAWTVSIRINFSWAFALQILAFAWIVTSSMAYLTVINGQINQHKEWMIRSYVVTFAFVVFRWLSDLPLAYQLMEENTERQPTLCWLSWTIPLLITEIVFSWKKK